jgi:hypothetical protein
MFDSQDIQNETVKKILTGDFPLHPDGSTSLLMKLSRDSYITSTYGDEVNQFRLTIILQGWVRKEWERFSTVADILRFSDHNIDHLWTEYLKRRI